MEKRCRNIQQSVKNENECPVCLFCTFPLFVVSPTVAPLAVQPSALENISPVSPQAVVEVRLHSPCIDCLTPALLLWTFLCITEQSSMSKWKSPSQLDWILKSIYWSSSPEQRLHDVRLWEWRRYLSGEILCKPCVLPAEHTHLNWTLCFQHCCRPSPAVCCMWESATQDRVLTWFSPHFPHLISHF